MAVQLTVKAEVKTNRSSPLVSRGCGSLLDTPNFSQLSEGNNQPYHQDHTSNGELLVSFFKTKYFLKHAYQ